jgi:hypothetical protein
MVWQYGLWSADQATLESGCMGSCHDVHAVLMFQQPAAVYIGMQKAGA